MSNLQRDVDSRLSSCSVRQTLKTKDGQTLRATDAKTADAALNKPKEKLLMAEVKAKVGELKKVRTISRARSYMTKAAQM